MNDMIEVKAADLIGPSLNWVVAEIEGVEIKICLPYRAPAGNVFGPIVLECLHLMDARCELLDWSPSTDWSQGGPLIDKYGLSIGGRFQGEIHACVSVESLPKNRAVSSQTGHTHLIAACRAIVVAKLGDIVKVPRCLVMP